MSRIILIRGPICAGKSTTVESLRNSLEKCSLIDQDYLKRAIDNKGRSDWRSRIALDTSLYLARLLMREGRDIIAEIHSSVPKQYDEYEKLAKENDYTLFSFLLYPPLEVCLQRNKDRVVSDMWYKLSDEEIKEYWENIYKIEGETTFDTSVISVKAITEKIVNTVEK